MNPRKKQRILHSSTQAKIEMGLSEFVSYARISLSASKEVEAIVDSIDAIKEEYINRMGNLYQYAIQFDFQYEKLISILIKNIPY